MALTEGHWIRKRLTKQSDKAFSLFGDFLQEVIEFRTVIGELDVSQLRGQLKLHYRCQPSCSEDQKLAVLKVVFTLAHFFPHQYGDWYDLIKESEQSDLERLIKSPLAEKVSEGSKRPISPQELNLFPPQALYFDRSVDKLLKMFTHTDPTRGLSSDVVSVLREHYGTNQLPKPPRPNALKMIWEQVTDFMVLILIAAAIVEAAEKEFNSMIVLLVVVVLNTVIGFSQEWKASKTLNALMNLSVPQAHVVRDGQESWINSEELVPGDIVVLEEGDAVPADLRLIEVAQLNVVEGILTGESLPVQKTVNIVKAKTGKIPLGDCKGNAFMSTNVSNGRAKGLVVRTGLKTEANGSKNKVKTPIQRKLTRLGIYLVALAIFLCALVVAIGVAWKHDAREMVNIGLSLAVSVIPEGLVAVTTVTMALGVRRMALKKCIVRTLPAVESLGSVTVICSDKTGTLTEGKMGAAELWTTNDALYKFTESTSMDPEAGQIMQESEELRRRMIHVRRTVTSPSNKSDFPVDCSTLLPKPVNTSAISSYSNQMYYAMMVGSLCNNSDILKLTKLFERAFDSERKLMSSVYQQKALVEEKLIEADEHIMLCKGAPEELLRKCSRYMAREDTHINRLASSQPTKHITDHFASQVHDENTRMAAQGLRVLGLAYKMVKDISDDITKIDTNNLLNANYQSNPVFAEDDLIFVGLIGLIDPPKAGVKEAIETCQNAGIQVIMITGDHVETATAIAKQLGIFKADVSGMSRAILGRELDLISDDAILELNPFPSVFARVSPNNKLSIVSALQKRGELVAMTGDGVNDAPAIKNADIGVAMGIAGTEITKQAADIVLVDDNFTSIVHAVEEGRHVFDNILKFIVYLLSCNGAEIFLMLICTIANISVPLSVMMILWANIIADIPPAMALGIEPNESDLMTRKPRDPKMGVITKVTWLVIAMNSLIIAALAIAVHCLNLFVLNFPLEVARSSTFTALTTVQLVHSFNARSIHRSVFKTGITDNKWMIGAFLLSFCLMILGIYTPGLSDWLNLVPVGWQAWVMTVACVVFLIVFVELEKMGLRRMTGKF
ncbi:hypothetical protein BD560DRAFT_332314 [Blakeslea trispora]|nr:hypothetical protein BD560DRAFT_332314 [Blakeslea trispora]